MGFGMMMRGGSDRACQRDGRIRAFSSGLTGRLAGPGADGRGCEGGRAAASTGEVMLAGPIAVSELQIENERNPEDLEETEGEAVC
jgi:hypothetical protein